MKIITGHQPVYLPWLGLFHKIALADIFVFMDDVQYLDKDWNNRNRIKGPGGPFWLTAPVRLKASASRLLKDILLVSDGWDSRNHWQRDHWRSLQACYGRSPYWETHAPFFEKLYIARPWKRLVELNETILHYCLDVLDIDVEFVRASDVGFEGRKSDLVLDHCRKLEADVCVLGTHGRDYLIERDFTAQSVYVYYQGYRHPRYTQRFGDFCDCLSVVDLLFNCGPDSREILLSGNVTQGDLMAECGRAGEPGVIKPPLLEEVVG